MGTKIIGIVIAVFMCLTLCFPVTGHAAAKVVYTPHNATVVSAGPFGTSGTTVFCLIVDASTTPMYFKAPTPREQEMLAVALAAIANGRTIRIWKDDSTSLGGTTLGTATLLYGMELR